jgi:hypothetical protein
VNILRHRNLFAKSQQLLSARIAASLLKQRIVTPTGRGNHKVGALMSGTLAADAYCEEILPAAVKLSFGSLVHDKVKHT